VTDKKGKGPEKGASAKERPGATRPVTNKTDKVDQSSGKETPNTELPQPRAVEGAASARVVISDTLQVNDISDNCEVNQTQTRERCLAPGTRVIDWVGPVIESANCGSNISNIRRPDGKENCIAVDVLLRGCGYDNFFGLKNCRGRGWIRGNIVINGERP
jgi:hypothetical protein